MIKGNFFRHASINPDRPEHTVYASHIPSSIAGVSSRPVLEVPVDLLTTIQNGEDCWDHPLIREMHSEAMGRMRERAVSAQSLVAELDAITGAPLFEEAV